MSDDVLRKLPPSEIEDPHNWLLTDEEFESNLALFICGSSPNKWADAERKIRADRQARIDIGPREFVGGEALSPFDTAVMLLERAVGALEGDIKRHVTYFLHKSGH